MRETDLKSVYTRLLQGVLSLEKGFGITTICVDGPALAIALKNPKTRKVLVQIMREVDSAIFSRMTG